MKISTSFDYPPIPFRGLDWSAVDSDSYSGDPCDPVGHGETESDAIKDLIEQFDDGIPVVVH